MALDFPASPNINDTYTFGGVTWTYDGTTWKVLGRFQFTSSETDPIFTNSPSFNILQQNINNWNLAHGWGDHSTAGYLTGYTEVDPVFSSSPVGSVTTTQVNNWDTAYGWGNHAAAGYLTSYTETQTLDAVLALGSTTARDITTTGKIYYSNNFANSVDLPSATTYHGMFAHVHAEGHGYFAHAGAWTQLLDTGSSLSELADVSTTAPSANDVLTWDGSNWGPAAGGSGGANVTISDTAPGSASAGDLWWESDKGRLKIYYNDTDSTQWVDASPPLADATSIGGQGTVAMLASLIPDTNNAYDIGSAEYKIRDIYEDQSSDIRLKKDVVDYSGGLNFVESLRVVDFTWKEDVDLKAGKRETGFIAQELGAALEASNYNSWRLHNPNPDSYQGIDPKQLIPALVSAIQELSARLKELENK